MSVTFPEGIRAAGVASGIKGDGALDLAFVGFSDGGAHVGAAVFTKSAAAAAPVQVSRDHLRTSKGRIRGVVLSSGNANALTGGAGLDAARLMASLAVANLGGEDSEYLVCSTGLIGIPFPVERIEPGLALLAAELGTDPHAGERAAHAIRTTDTFAKEAQAVGDGFRVGGMAKGAAMIAPNMATMLCVLTTDATLTLERAQSALGWVVDQTFNRITIDGCTSTNDTVVLLASEVGSEPGPDFEESLLEVAAKLAYAIVSDAEGGSKVGRVRVHGGASVSEAEACARRVASSLLVKCSLLGGDPYWGRVLAEVGNALPEADVSAASVAYQGIRVCEGGLDASAQLSGADRRRLDHRMQEREIVIEIDLGRGSESVEVLTADIGHGYLEENRGTS